MRLLYRFRRRRMSSYLRPDGRVLRSIQAPHHVTSEDGRLRISSAAFSTSSGDDGSCSVDLEQLLQEDNLTATTLYPSIPRSVGLVSLKVGRLREVAVTVEHEPVVHNWYHGGLGGAEIRKKKSKLKKLLAQECEPVVEIDPNLVAHYHDLPRDQGLVS